METIKKTIEVDLPTEVVYNQWTQFEEFPRFMEGVESVQQLDDKRLHWKANIGGKNVEWFAEISEQRPEEIIEWRSISGTKNIGSVEFTPLESGDRTLVSLNLSYEPEGVVEKTADALGFVSSKVQGDLNRFKEFIEKRHHETGAWRGEIHNGESVSA